jgi:NADPH:quinone reductase-like Zn-dependent oxidoreductase
MRPVFRGRHGTQFEVRTGEAGEGPLGRSLQAFVLVGSVVVVGRVAGGGSVSLLPAQLIEGAQQLRGVTVGSRTMLDQQARLVNVTRLTPVIHRVFPFDDARAALEHMVTAQHFDKVVVNVS